MYKTIYGKTQAELRQKVQAWKSTQTVDRIDKHEYTFSQWADMWFQIHRNNVSPTTAESYRYSLRKHISESGDSIQVEQAVCMVKGTVTLGPPKSRDSYRTIPVPPSLWECAKALRRTTRTFIWEERTPGKPCNPSFFRKQFQNALRSLPGVRVLTPHCCRHTYVSQMQALHVDLSTLQRIVGHSDIDMTKHYLTVQESILKEAAEKFSKAFPLE